MPQGKSNEDQNVTIEIHLIQLEDAKSPNSY